MALGLGRHVFAANDGDWLGVDHVRPRKADLVRGGRARHGQQNGQPLLLLAPHAGTIAPGDNREPHRRRVRGRHEVPGRHGVRGNRSIRGNRTGLPGAPPVTAIAGRRARDGRGGVQSLSEGDHQPGERHPDQAAAQTANHRRNDVNHGKGRQDVCCPRQLADCPADGNVKGTGNGGQVGEDEQLHGYRAHTSVARAKYMQYVTSAKT